MKEITIQRKNDIDYGSAANGTQVGSGYDVTVKRESKRIAIVCVTELSSRQEWMTLLNVEPDQDLQALACQIGQCPSAELGGWPTDEDWNVCVERWNAIEVE